MAISFGIWDIQWTETRWRRCSEEQQDCIWSYVVWHINIYCKSEISTLFIIDVEEVTWSQFTRSWQVKEEYQQRCSSQGQSTKVLEDPHSSCTDTGWDWISEACSLLGGLELGLEQTPWLCDWKKIDSILEGHTGRSLVEWKVPDQQSLTHAQMVWKVSPDIVKKTGMITEIFLLSHILLRMTTQQICNVNLCNDVWSGVAVIVLNEPMFQYEPRIGTFIV